MKPKTAPWNTNNHNVLIFAGKHYEEFALKYGICICPNEIELIPSRYIALYNNDTISYLFEIVKPPLDDVSIENSEEIKNIHQIEKHLAKEWQNGNEICRLFVVKKVFDIGPIINDFISPITKKPTPFTCGSPRYTTYTRIREAKLTSDLKCIFDDDCPPTQDVVAAPVITPLKKKKNFTVPIIIAIFSILILALAALLYFNKPKQIVQTKIVKESLPPKIVLPYLYFDSGVYELGKKQIIILEEVHKQLAPMMEKYTNLEIKIVGFADARGSEKANIELSEKRAGNIRNWLVARGLDSTRIFASGKGMIVSDSISVSKSEEINRRIEFQISYK